MVGLRQDGGVPETPPASASEPAFDVGAVDAEIARIDAVLTAQLNEILHHPDVRRLEAAWRSLKFLVDRTEFGANIQVEIFSVTKTELVEDLQRGESLSRLHNVIRRETFERGEAHPYTLLVVDHDFGSCEEDVTALEQLATLTARAHAQCLTAPAPALLGLASWRELPGWCRRPPDAAHGAFGAARGTARYARWRALRERDESLHLSLCLPRFQLRPRYGAATAPVRLFPFEETAGEADASPLWGSAALLAASAICNGFAEVGWFLPRLRHRAMMSRIGPSATMGTAPIDPPPGGEGTLPSEVECVVTPRGGFVLSEAGLSYVDAAQRGVRMLWEQGASLGSTSIQSGNPSVPYLFLYLAMVRCVHAQYHARRRQGDTPAEIERAVDAWLGRFDRKRRSGDPTPLTPGLWFQCAELSIERGAGDEQIAHLRLNLSHDHMARPFHHAWPLSSAQHWPTRALSIEAAVTRFDAISRAWTSDATEGSAPATRGELERCWDAFQRADQTALAEGRPARWLGRQIQCALLLASAVAPRGSSSGGDAWWYDRPLLAWPGREHVEIVPPEHRALGWWPTLGELREELHEVTFAVVGDHYGRGSPDALADRGYLLRVAAVFGSPVECSIAWPRLVDRAGRISDPRARAETLAFLECSNPWLRVVDRAGRIADPRARAETLAFLASRSAARVRLDAQVLSLASSLAATTWDSDCSSHDARAAAYALLARLDAVAACIRWLPDGARRSVLEPLLTETLALPDSMYGEPRALVLEGLHLFLTDDLLDRALCAAEAEDSYYAPRMLRALAYGADTSIVERVAASMERIRVGSSWDLLHISRARLLPRALVEALPTRPHTAATPSPELQRRLALEQQLLLLHSGSTIAQSDLDAALDNPFLLPLLAADLPGELWPRALDALDTGRGLAHCSSEVMCLAGRGRGRLSDEGALAELLMAIAPHVPEAHWSRVRARTVQFVHPSMQLAVLVARLVCSVAPPPLRHERLVDLLRVGAQLPRVFLLNALVACVEIVRDLSTDDAQDDVGRLAERLASGEAGATATTKATIAVETMRSDLAR